MSNQDDLNAKAEDYVVTFIHAAVNVLGVAIEMYCKREGAIPLQGRDLVIISEFKADSGETVISVMSGKEGHIEKLFTATTPPLPDTMKSLLDLQVG